MREIKFARYSFSHKEMQYSEKMAGGLEEFFGNTHGEEVSEPLQYTGLKDKNGVDIYEKDIVKGTSGEYEDEIWEIAMEQDRDLNGWSITPEQAGECIIIGNLYENPELLERAR